MALPIITVSGLLKDQHDDPASGTVVFRLTAPVHDTDSNVIYVPNNEMAVLDSNGAFSIGLVASQGLSANPQGVGYSILYNLKGVRPQIQYTVMLPEELGSAVDLSDLPPAVMADPVATISAANIPFTPAGTVSSSTVQAAIEEIAAETTSAGAPLLHVQETPSANWSVVHNLGYRPMVDILEEGGNKVQPDILHASLNAFSVIFATPTIGYAISR